MSRTAVVLFTRDLRVHDNQALAAATRDCEVVAPLFVVDDTLLASANRVAFLLESLADLRHGLAGSLVVRQGDPVAEVARLQPDVVYLSEDVSPYARKRERRLREIADVRALPGITVVPSGDVAPAGADHYRVFTPYWRAWRSSPLPAAVDARLPVRLPAGVEPGPIPELADLVSARPAQDTVKGGEGSGLSRLGQFVDASADVYGERRDALSTDGTSRLSSYLHFGCVSPAEAARRADARGAEAFLRQLCWRDFYAQLLAARPTLARDDLRPARRDWLDDPAGLAAWKEGRTGYPVVDAGMRQLLAEGWMHNRARMIVASFLTKDLLVDWRLGAAHFMEYLVDGDVASNAGNWQWVAGTGTDSRPGRFFNPTIQGRRFDPSGDYVRRWVPELSSVPDMLIHEPPTAERRACGYPDPIVEHLASVRRWSWLQSSARPVKTSHGA